MVNYKFVKSVGLLGITNFIVALNTLIIIPILTKNLSASDYGIWIQFLTTFFLITSIAGLGLPYTIIRFISIEKDKKNIQEGFYSMATLILISSFFVSLLFFLFSKLIADNLFNGNINIVKIISLLIFLGPINSLFINLFVAFGQMKRYSLLLLFQTYLSLFLVGYFAISGNGILFIVIGFFITQLILFLVMFLVIFYEIGFKIPKFNYLREYLNFSLPIIPNNLATWIVESSDRYVIGIILGTTFVAYYSPGYTLGMVILLFFTPLSVILSSTLPDHYEKGEIKEVIVYINYSLKYFLLISIPSFFILSLLSKPLMILMTTYEIASNGYFITPFIAISSILFGALGIIINFMILEKKTKIIGSIWTITAMMSFLNLILVPFFGILAAAVVTLISYLTAFIIGTKYSLKFFKYTFDYHFILKSVFASIIASIPLIIINPKELFIILVLIGVFITSYLFILLIVNGISSKEINFFKAMFKTLNYK